MRKFVLVLSAAALFSCAAIGSNIVVNPGFETGDFTGWTSSAWTVASSEGIVPHSGSFYADTGCVGAPCITTPTSFFYQDLATVMGQNYTFSFWYDLGDSTCVGCEGPPDDPNDTFAEIQAFFNGVSVNDATENNVSDPGYVFFTVNAMATSTTTRIEFLGRQDPGEGGVDDVCVDVVGGSCGGASGVPEPTTMFLFGGGLTGLGIFGLMRRRFATTRELL